MAKKLNVTRVTISLHPEILEKAKENAAAMGISLGAYISISLKFFSHEWSK